MVGFRELLDLLGAYDPADMFDNGNNVVLAAEADSGKPKNNTYHRRTDLHV
jgi:hypothetical protein